MKSIKWLLISMLTAIIAVSCLRNPDDPFVPIEENFFDWKTVVPVSLNIEVEPISGPANNYCRTVNFYSSPTFSKSSLLNSGSIMPDKPFKFTLDFPSSYENIYVEIISPNGIVERSSQKLDKDGNGEVVVSVKSGSTKALTKASGFPINPVPEWGTIPETFNYTFSEDIMQSVTLIKNNTYYVPTDKSIRAFKGYYSYLDCWNWAYGTNAVLYIAGSLTLLDANLNNVSIVVLNGGELIVRGSFNSNTSTSKPLLYIMEGGHAKFEEGFEIGGGNTIVNKGTIAIGNNKTLRVNTAINPPSFYNTGTIDASVGYVEIDGRATFHNSGIVNADKFIVSSALGSSVTNYESGAINAVTYLQTNTNNVTTNYGFINTTNMDLQGIIDNYGYIASSGTPSTSDKKPNVTLHAANIIVHEGALFSANTMKMGFSTFSLKSQAIVTIKSIPADSWSYTFENFDEGHALVVVYNNLCPLTGHLSTIDGKIEIFHQGLGSSGNILEEDYKKGGNYINNSYFVGTQEERKVNIPESPYNQAIGVITPPTPSITDKDGDGVPNNIDIDDNDPTIAYRSYFPGVNTYGTILAEDLWPYIGDYDMNDLVLDYNIEWTSNADNKVVYVDVNWKLRAIGGTKKIGMAIQFDQIASGSVANVSTTHEVGSGPMQVSGGMELYQPLAVVPLFNDPAEIFGEGNSTLVNTIPAYPYISPVDNNFRITFTSPIEMSTVSLSTINPFLVVTDFDNPMRYWEIHLPGYKRTAMASKKINNTQGLSQSDIYLSNTGMMWMLMIPESIHYGVEAIEFGNVYTNYKNWYTSGGNFFQDWYKDIPGYINLTNVYAPAYDPYSEEE